MQRITNQVYAEAISYAFDLIGPKISCLLGHVHFLTGTDPIYAGLHRYIVTDDGRPYCKTAHVVYPWHSKNKRERTTVVLPQPCPPATIVHELGHCLDEVLGFRHIALPINDYARTNRAEAFAEAFTAQWFWMGEEGEDIWQSDRSTQSLLLQLKG